MKTVKIKKCNGTEIKKVLPTVMELEKVFPWEMQWSKKLLLKKALPEYDVFLAKDKDKIVGYSLSGERVTAGEKAYYLYAIVIHKNYRGFGIGKNILKKTIALAKLKKYKTYEMHTLNPAMKGLAEKYGFFVKRIYYNYIGKDKQYVLHKEMEK